MEKPKIDLCRIHSFVNLHWTKADTALTLGPLDVAGRSESNLVPCWAVRVGA